jgi:soluble cytochrome b562
MIVLFSRSIALCAALLLSTPFLLLQSAHAQNTGFDLAHQMKTMKLAYRAAMSSDNINTFKLAYFKLKALSLQAAQQPYDGNADEQALYKQGMKQLQADYLAIDLAISRNDLPTAKAALEHVHQTEKTYHQKLDV